MRLVVTILLLGSAAAAQQTIQVTRTHPDFDSIRRVHEYIGTDSPPRNFDYAALGQTLNTLWPQWRSSLPACPCAEPRSDASWNRSNFNLDKYHPGASNCYRSTPVPADRVYRLAWLEQPGAGPRSTPELISGLTHGQQCCYDGAGNLFINGPAAGTPDFVAPDTTRAIGGYFGVMTDYHNRLDVRSFESLSWQRYAESWGYLPTHTPACEIVLPANRRFTYTGRWFEKGETIDIKASGQIKWSVWQGFLQPDATRCDPDGTPRERAPYASPSDPIPTAAIGALVGCMLPSGATECSSYFLIGKAKRFAAPASGYLVLTVNDMRVENNSGEFTIHLPR